MIVDVADAPDLAHELVAEHEALLTDSIDFETGEPIYGLRSLRKLFDGRTDPPWMPPDARIAYRELIKKGRANWLRLVVLVIAQRLFVDGFRSSMTRDADEAAWLRWQRNNLDSGQKRVYNDMFTCGLGWVTVWPNVDVPRITVQSPLRMHARTDPEDAEIIDVGIRRWQVASDRFLALYDDEKSIRMRFDSGKWVPYELPAEHKLGESPIVQFPNDLDSDGAWHSEITPLIPVQYRIDETLLDRLVNQKFVAFPQRWATGYLDEGEDEDIPAPFMALIDRMLTAESPDTAFGAFPTSDLKQYIESVGDDVRQMAALGQVPSHFLLGGIVDLSGLTAAEASIKGKIGDKQVQAGERWESTMRKAALAAGDEAGATDWSSQVIWRDSSSQADSALMDGFLKLKEAGVPLEFRLERLGLTPQTIERVMSMARDEAAEEAAATATAFGIPTRT